MNNSWHDAKGPGLEKVTHTWDIVQNDFQCCGIERPEDWTLERTDIFPDGEVPDSCCEEGQKEGCGADPNAKKFSKGCYIPFKAKFSDNITIVGGVAFGVAAIEVAIVLLACCLGKMSGYTSLFPPPALGNPEQELAAFQQQDNCP